MPTIQQKINTVAIPSFSKNVSDGGVGGAVPAIVIIRTIAMKDNTRYMEEVCILFKLIS